MSEIIIKNFFSFFNGEYIKLSSEPLISRLFPTSFTSSAGPSGGLEMMEKDFLRKYPLKSCVVQPCIRYWDLDCIGDDTHLSFFQMGAIVSFIKNDRKKILQDILRFVQNESKIALSRIWGTYYKSGKVYNGYEFETDFEGQKILQNIGILPENIVGVTSSDGFVANDVEPFGGYKLEIYIELSNNGRRCANCKPSHCECNRFLELITTIYYEYQVDNINKTIRKLDDFQFFAAGFGIERLESAIDKSYKILETSQVKSIINSVFQINEKYNLGLSSQEVLKVAEILRALVHLHNEKADFLHGKSNKGRRWILNKYINIIIDNFADNFEVLEIPYNEVISSYGNLYALKSSFCSFKEWLNLTQKKRNVKISKSAPDYLFEMSVA